MTRKRVKQRAAIGALGKDVTRRSRGRCELCEGREGTRLYELPPFPEAPDLERVLMTCARCRGWLEDGDVDPVSARFLSTAVWSELRPVRLAAARLLVTCDFQEDPWVRDALDAAGFDPVTEELLDA